MQQQDMVAALGKKGFSSPMKAFKESAFGKAMKHKKTKHTKKTQKS